MPRLLCLAEPPTAPAHLFHELRRQIHALGPLAAAAASLAAAARRPILTGPARTRKGLHTTGRTHTLAQAAVAANRSVQVITIVFELLRDEHTL